MGSFFYVLNQDKIDNSRNKKNNNGKCKLNEHYKK